MYIYMYDVGEAEGGHGLGGDVGEAEVGHDLKVTMKWPKPKVSNMNLATSLWLGHATKVVMEKPKAIHMHMYMYGC